MGRVLTLDDLQRYIELARDKLSLDREEILYLAPLPDDFSRDSYGFSYLRAERVGMSVIAERLDEVSWLPMQLDPNAEVLPESKQTIKKWLGSSPDKQPDSACFGNDFIHALTRVALTNGWQSNEFRNTSYRIGLLFHDLSCLIGLIYYGLWMTENGFGSVSITDPKDLERTVKEITAIIRSPEILDYLYQRQKAKTAGRKAPATKKKKPALHIVKNPEIGEEQHPT